MTYVIRYDVMNTTLFVVFTTGTQNALDANRMLKHDNIMTYNKFNLEGFLQHLSRACIGFEKRRQGNARGTPAKGNASTRERQGNARERQGNASTPGNARGTPEGTPGERQGNARGERQGNASTQPRGKATL